MELGDGQWNRKKNRYIENMMTRFVNTHKMVNLANWNLLMAPISLEHNKMIVQKTIELKRKKRAYSFIHLTNETMNWKAIKILESDNNSYNNNNRK